MDNPAEPVSVPAPERPGLGLAVACLVLGILACVFSLLVVGAALGVVGLILGAIHVGQYRKSRTMAWWGIGLCVAGILASAAMGVFYVRWARQALNGAETGSGAIEKWKGGPAPDVTLTALDGKAFKLDQLRGKRVVLDFWATWCGPCVREIPHFIKLRSETSDKDLVIIGISDEDTATLTPFVKQKGMNYIVISAPNLPSPYKDVQAIPTTFFIDGNGIIQSIVVGYHDYDQLKKLALPE